MRHTCGDEEKAVGYLGGGGLPRRRATAEGMYSVIN